MDTYQKVIKAADFLKKQTTEKINVGVILGSGLSNFVDDITVQQEIDYSEIPHFPIATVEGHAGKLIFGTIDRKLILAMAGRLHYYEGYTPEEVIFPIRVMKFLGINTLLISNAAGGVDRSLKVGDLMIITDLISMAAVNPLVGKNDNRFGPRFPDMSEPFSKNLISKAKQVARQQNIEVKEGVYFGVTGPTFESRAEYKMIDILGGDAVGMSTVQEVIAANHLGMNVFAMSVITDIGIREEENKITHEEVLQAAKDAEPKFSAIFTKLISSIDN